MRVLAIIAAACFACSPAPASLPWVSVDRTLRGAVCSRDAAIAIAQKRAEERGEWEKRMVDCGEQRELSEARAKRAQWWQVNAPWMIGGTGIVAIVVGFVAGFAVGERK